MTTAILNDLTPTQAEAAALTGPVLALAGAGTGKTKTLTAGITHRLAVKGMSPHRILAVTFTNKAAAEMRSRVRATSAAGQTPSWIGTFHGLGARQLRVEPEIAGLRDGFEILDADDSKRIVRRLLQSRNAAQGADVTEAVGRDPIKLVANKLSSFKDNLLTPATAGAFVEAQIATPGMGVDPTLLRLAAALYGDYQRALREANAADFGDLLLWPVLAMCGNAEYRARWAGRFDAIMADEYQDVGPAQYAWLKLLAADHRELFCVGDDDQSIYGWRGADVRYIRRFRQDFPEARQICLEENFRSTAHILAGANAVIALDESRLGKTLFTRKPEGDAIELVRFSNPESEAAGIVKEIGLRQREGLVWRDMAILYRTNALSRTFEEELLRARIPHVLVGDVGFYQRLEIKNALALLRLIASPDSRQSDEAFRRVINTPARGFGPRTMQMVEDEAALRGSSLLSALEMAPLPPRARAEGLVFLDAIRDAGRSGLTVADRLALILDTTGYRNVLRTSEAEDAEGRLANLQELIGLAGQFHSPRDLLDHASLSTSGPRDEDADCVRLLTLHRSKGLEFAHVFLPAFEEGVFPSSFGDAAEERRLAYVAITRGMRRVTISHCEFRRGSSTPSRFTSDLPPSCVHYGWLRAVDSGRQARKRLVDAAASLWGP